MHTKERILRIAHKLFSSRGYDNTPISLILEKAEISKGGFYHYFSSKEDILDLLAKARVEDMLEVINQIAYEPRKPALEKFDQLLEQVQMFRHQNRDQLFKIYGGYLKPENLHLKHKIETYTLNKVLPPYANIIKQGITEGVFHTSSPEFAAETIIRMAPVLRLKMITLYVEKDSNDHYEADIEQAADFLEEFVLKTLGANMGVLRIAASFKNYFLR